MPQLSKLCLAILAALMPIALVLAQTAPTSPDNSPRPLLTGYFPQWGLYNQPQYLVKNLVTTGGGAMLDQLNYAQGFVTNGRCSIADPNADLNYTFTAAQSVDDKADNPREPFRGNLHQLAELKRRYPRLKLIISLEGHPSDFARNAQPENRDTFVASCVDLFLKGNFAPGIHAPGLFDGIDIDWEYPRQEDAANYLALLTAFRQRMDALHPGLRLNIAVGASPRIYAGTDMAAISRIVDQVGLMTYDFAGPWSGITGFVAPLRLDPRHHNNGTVEDTVREYLAAGVPPAKLLVGIPFYGYGWHLVEETNNGLFQEGDAIRGDRPYRDIQTIAQRSTIYRDDASQSPYLFDGDSFWTYEDAVSIRSKTDFARQQHLGGLMIWELGEDTADALLLQSAYSALTIAPAPVAAVRPVAEPELGTPKDTPIRLPNLIESAPIPPPSVSPARYP